jgi:hypothetical protein
MNTATAFKSPEGGFPFPNQSQIEALVGLESNIINVLGASISQRADQTYFHRWHGRDTLSWGDAYKWIDAKFLVGLVENPTILTNQYLGRLVENSTIFISQYMVGLRENPTILSLLEQYPIIKGIMHRDEIENIYKMSLSDDVKAWLSDHPGVAQIVIEARPHILNAFGQTSQVRMLMVKDPEISNFEELIAYIITDLSVNQALDSLDRFDNQWFLNQLDRLDGNFSFNLGIV